MKEPAELLKSYQLRVTPVRKAVLDIFGQRNEAISQPEFERLLHEYDRVTLYRTLATFEEKGLVHKIMNEGGVGNYALCTDACGPDHHHDGHVHLECDECGKVYCLDEVEIPEIKIPVHYRAHGLKILVHGRCDQCST